MSPRPTVLLVCFDGLRPDLIGPGLTPNIVRLQRLGVRLARHRTVYPSETRVAFPSLVTGAPPAGHGMVGNMYVDRSTGRYIDTSDARLLDELDRGSGVGLMTATSLGEVLGQAGRTMAVLATNTPGTTRLFHHRAERFSHVRLSGHFREACTPDAFLAEVEARFGALPPDPPKGTPDIAAQTLITSAFLELVWPKLKPDVTILSFGEPDTCSHFNGTGGGPTREVIAHCDAELGRILDWWESDGAAAGVQIGLLSDHGHITGHTRVSVIDTLLRAGLRPGPAPGPDVDAIVVPGHVGAIYVANGSSPNRERVVRALIETEWCGNVFTAGRNEIDGVVDATLSTRLVGLDHPRAPDVVFAFRTDDRIDPFGLAGGTFYDNDRRAGLGLHGGLHPKELAALGAFAGSHFRSGLISELPSSICDIAPTILALLGLTSPLTMRGRVLFEAIADGALSLRRPLDVQPPKLEVFEAHRGGYRQLLQRQRFDKQVYLDGGMVGVDAAQRPSLHHVWGAA